MALAPALKALLNAPKYAARPSAYQKAVTIASGSGGKPRSPPRASLLDDLFSRIGADAQDRGIGWGEWMTVLVRRLAHTDRDDVCAQLAWEPAGDAQVCHAP